MRRFKRGLVLGFSTLAITVPGAMTTATAATSEPALSCPATDAACFYMDNNYQSIITYADAGNWISSFGIYDDTMSSLRNRTGCTVRLWDQHNWTGSTFTVAPYTDAPQFNAAWNDRVKSMSYEGCS